MANRRIIDKEGRVAGIKYLDADTKYMGGHYCLVRYRYHVEVGRPDVGVSFFGECGDVMTEDELDVMLDEYWAGINIEDEFSHWWDDHLESTGRTKPELPETKAGIEGLLVEGHYETELEKFNKDKAEYFRDLEVSLKREAFPFELKREGDYAFVFTNSGNIFGKLCDPKEAYVVPNDKQYMLQSLCAVVEAWDGEQVTPKQVEKIEGLMSVFPTVDEFVEMLEEAKDT